MIVNDLQAVRKIIDEADLVPDAVITKLVEEIEWLRFSRAVKPEWEVGTFFGPCAHGRDPYTRCEEGCENLTPREALEVAAATRAFEGLVIEVVNKTGILFPLDAECLVVSEGPAVKGIKVILTAPKLNGAITDLRPPRKETP